MEKQILMYGQIVLGPPGSGKTTYCHGMQQFLTGLKRRVLVVNLDPANDLLPYQCDVSITELIRLEEAMDTLDLGPNGAMVYCIEYLAKNVEWLIGRLIETAETTEKGGYKEAPYFLFDLPGQVELFTHHSSLHDLVRDLTRELNLRLCAVHLVDSFHCADPAQFISVVFVSLASMLRIELPHVNVLSKIDLLESRGELQFGLEFYTDLADLDYLLPLIPNELRSLEQGGDAKAVQETMKEALESNDEDNATGVADKAKKPASAFTMKFRKLNEALCKLVEDYQLVSFKTLNIEDKESVYELTKYIDKTISYVESSGVSSMEASASQKLFLQERYTPSSFS